MGQLMEGDVTAVAGPKGKRTGPRCGTVPERGR